MSSILRRVLRSGISLCFVSIQSTGTSQIRRVRLPRIADEGGHVSYEELVGLVVTFTFPAESSSSAENFDCILTYFDEDEDAVTIASTSELVDAVEQFVDKKVLRISTEVKRKTSAGASAPQTIQTPQPSIGTADRGTSTQPESLEANLQTVLESFASVVVTAVSSLEKGLAANSATNVARATPSSQNNPKVSEEPTKPVPKPAPQPSAAAQLAENQKHEFKDAVVPHIHHRHTCDSCLMNPIVGARYHALNMTDYDICENCYPNYSGKETEFVSYPTGNQIVRKNSVAIVRDGEQAPAIQDGANLSSEELARLFLLADESSNPAPQEAAPEPASEPAPSTEFGPSPAENSLPFIHGRHTCDSCLMNPIIGKRYHAMNLKDYDLCEKCYPNYQGAEIHLEAVELRKFFLQPIL